MTTSANPARAAVKPPLFTTVLACHGGRAPTRLLLDETASSPLVLGRQVKNRCRVTRFEFGKYHPGIRRRAVVVAWPPVRDTVLLQVRQWYEVEEHGSAPLFRDVPMIAAATAVLE